MVKDKYILHIISILTFEQIIDHLKYYYEENYKNAEVINLWFR